MDGNQKQCLYGRISMIRRIMVWQVYSSVYHVPVLFLRGRRTCGTLLPPEQIWADIARCVNVCNHACQDLVLAANVCGDRRPRRQAEGFAWRDRWAAYGGGASCDWRALPNAAPVQHAGEKARRRRHLAHPRQQARRPRQSVARHPRRPLPAARAVRGVRSLRPRCAPASLSVFRRAIAAPRPPAVRSGARR